MAIFIDHRQQVATFGLAAAWPKYVSCVMLTRLWPNWSATSRTVKPPAVSLALVERGRPIVAETTAPFLDLRYNAIRDRGSFVNGQRMRASRTSELSKAIVSIGDYTVGEGAEPKNEQRIRLTALLADRVERVRMFGSAALDLAWVAEGRTDAAVILANKPRDTAAGVLLAREAGAQVLDSTGEPHSFNSSDTIVTCPGIADAVVSLVQTLHC
jgi:myo-inositol-1(or 4)-monophosphatase